MSSANEANIEAVNSERIPIEESYSLAAAKHEWMIEWRYKIFTRYYVSTGAIAATIGWLINTKNESLEDLVYLPIILGALNGLMFFIMNRRNKLLIDACEGLLVKIEKDHCEGVGVYTAWNFTNKWPPSYDVILGSLYLGTFLLLLLVCAVVYVTKNGITIA
jgi:hypothetical protein